MGKAIKGRYKMRWVWENNPESLKTMKLLLLYLALIYILNGCNKHKKVKII